MSESIKLDVIKGMAFHIAMSYSDYRNDTKAKHPKANIKPFREWVTTSWVFSFGKKLRPDLALTYAAAFVEAWFPDDMH